MIDLVRFEQSLLLGGEAEQQVTCALAKKLTRLFAVNADWTLQCLIPRFSGDTANAAWGGFLEQDLLENVPRQLLGHLKAPFLEAASSCTKWLWQENAPKLFAQFYVDMYEIIPFPEALQLLRNLGDEGRCEVVQRLAPFWRDYLKPLLENGWPKDKRCKTETLSAALADAVLETGEDFPKAVDLALPFLVPTKIYCLGNLNIFQDEIDARIQNHPETCLKLLHRLVPNQYKPNEAWQVLPTILDQIALVKPSLKQAPAYRRLYCLATRAS